MTRADVVLGTHKAGVRERAEFYARCSVLEDLRYGVEVDRPTYAKKALRSLAWLFPSGGGHDLDR